MNHPLIPAGAMYANVEHVEFDIRTMVEYQADFMQDRLLVSSHIDGERTPAAYMTMMGFENIWDVSSEEAFLELHGAIQPKMRRNVIDRHLGLGYQADVDALEEALSQTLAEVMALRRPWWRKTYDKLGSWISGVR